MCPSCEQVYRSKSVICWLDGAGKVWSDGYRAHDVAHEYPLITRCDECYGYFWISSVHKFNNRGTQMNKFALNHQLTPGSNKFPSVRKLTPEEYAEVLAIKKYHDPDEELYLRTHLWWTINTPLRDGIQEEIAPELKELFEENLETLIYKTPLNGAESQLTLAEIHRELGLFKQAEKHLDKVTDPNYEQFLLKMRQRIEISDRRVFLI